MWSETVSVINLQTFRSILKSAQKCAIFTFKIKKFWGDPTPFVSPQFALSSQYLWIRHWREHDTHADSGETSECLKEQNKRKTR